MKPNILVFDVESTNFKLLQPPLLVVDVNSSTSWDEWLSETENKLKELGYKRYVQNHNHEDFCYWKTFKNGEDEIYQIGILFYDFRKYAYHDPHANRIGIAYDCILSGKDRIDMVVHKNINLVEFENMAQTFYKAISHYAVEGKLKSVCPNCKFEPMIKVDEKYKCEMCGYDERQTVL